MTTKTMAARAGGFLISEANGTRSRDNGTLALGQNLPAGTILAASGSYVTEWTDDTAIGVLLEAVDASLAAKPCAYIARDAEVVFANLSYSDETNVTADDAKSALKSLGIIPR